MAVERSVFERLESIETTNESTNKMVAEILEILKNKQVNTPTQPQFSERELIQIFLREAKKFWRWFGNNTSFMKWKTLAILSLILLMIVGIATTIISSICFELYSTFTLFENVWLIFAVFYLIYVAKAQLTYEVDELASNSSYNYETDHLGMKFQRKEKGKYRVFKWIAIISSILNIICIWTGVGKSEQIIATIMEVLYIGAIVFAFFMNANLFAQYSIIWVEGHNLTTGKEVVLVLPPGAEQLMPVEDFKKKMPFFFE